MNIISLQERLKDFSEQQLVSEMQMPSGQVPQFLLLTELNRRKRMMDQHQADMAQGDQQTVAQDLLAAAGLPAAQAGHMAATMAPQTDMMGNTGAQMAPQPQAPEPATPMTGAPLMMREGGIVALQEGGAIRRPRPHSFVRDGMQYIFNDRGDPVLWGPVASPDILSGGNIGPLSGGAQVPDRFPALPEFEPTGPAIPPRAARPTSPEEVQTWSDDFYRVLGGAAEPALRALDQSPAGQARSGLPSTRGTPLTVPEDPNALLPGYEPPAPAAEESLLPWWMRMDPEAAPGEALERILFPGRDPAEIRARRLAQGQEGVGLPEAAPETPPAPAVAEAAGDVPASPVGSEPSGGIAALVPPAGGAPTTPTTAPGASGTASPGSFEEFLQQRMEQADADRSRDKWLALAQFGLALMSSEKPTLGGAVGEAGTQALQSLRGSYEDYNKTMMELYGTREQLMMGREQMAMRRAAGSGRGSSPRAMPVGALAALDRQIDYLTTQMESATTAKAKDDAFTALQNVKAQRDLVNRAFFAQYGLDVGAEGAPDDDYMLN